MTVVGCRGFCPRLVILLWMVAGVLAGGEEQDVDSEQLRICSLPKALGFCRARMVKYLFNPSTKRCEYFLYSGCGGNENNFGSLRECHDACSGLMLEGEGRDNGSGHLMGPHCSLPPIDRPFACAGAFQRYTFSPSTLSCEPYLYGGCGATPNVYSTVEECISSCIHHADGAGGNRRGGMVGPRAQAGGNPVGSLAFPGFAEDKEDICQLPPVEPGLLACLGFSQRWTYDARQGACIQYSYGGCRGTKNLFDTEEDCMAACPKEGRSSPSSSGGSWTRPSLCSQPAVQPSPFACAAFMPRFTFNTEAGKCEPYIYGGCGATENLFNSLGDCLSMCDKPAFEEQAANAKTVDVCSQALSRGPCRAAKPRFGFNNDKKRCEMFLYGGKKILKLILSDNSRSRLVRLFPVTIRGGFSKIINN